ncbi:sigma-54-dependent transcriptional regulator [Pseudodesulfovibrio indicus]|uniref:Fis family transcriptional regulator n=1 Tax=Pseudodesulfovibrio indicus TaxID=1716143 RepID=A0A126QM94_9BACT|nr:sigma-54 dependent transcriptional regulator [Pseudodesulfovibrio indicus]AMK10926.1 Fis family transcriptional regulator [Pseudodesulfovibrio indicus]TDT91920.1 two-component system NtrC family response regulator [Pseudodesulfovibrio indicus]
MTDILIIDGDESFVARLADSLLEHGFAADRCDSLSKAMGILHTGSYKVVLIGDDLPDGDGVDYLAEVREVPSFPEAIVLSHRRDPDVAERAIQNGAWNYVLKPVNLQRLLVLLERAVTYHTKVHSGSCPVSLRRQGIIGNSRPMLSCLDSVAQAATSDINVLLVGETGTGKELFARSIHKNSARKEKPFVVVDCAALPDTLAESLLFGHERGAFTSADSPSVGLVKQADRGTLFLDEVGELPMSLQKVFLRVLEGRSFRPVGGTREITSDFRLLSATNRDLEDMVAEGEFRRDLYFRLRGMHIALPPLREIAEDINEMTCKFIQRHCEKFHMSTKGFSPDFLDALMHYEWPGNVRELMHTLEQALSRAGDDAVLFPRHLPKAIRARLARRELESDRSRPAPTHHSEAGPAETFPDLRTYRDQQLAQSEQRYLRNLMEITGGDIAASCSISGLSRARLYALLKQHSIPRK